MTNRINYIYMIVAMRKEISLVIGLDHLGLQLGSVPWIFGITPKVQNHIEGVPYHVLNMTGYFSGVRDHF